MTNGPESRPSHDTDDGGTAGQGSGEHACERVTSCQNETPPGRPPPRPSGQGEWRARRPRPAVLRSGPRALGPPRPVLARLLQPHAETVTCAPHWRPEAGRRSGRAVASASVTGRAGAQGLSRGPCVSTGAQTCSRHGPPAAGHLAVPSTGRLLDQEGPRRRGRRPRPWVGSSHVLPRPNREQRAPLPRLRRRESRTPRSKISARTGVEQQLSAPGAAH